MAAQAAGLSVFLLTDCLLNRKEKDISSYPQGDFDALLAFVEEWGGEASLYWNGWKERFSPISWEIGENLFVFSKFSPKKREKWDL